MNEITPIETPEGRPARVRKPDWIRVKAPTSKGFNETRKLMRDLNLNTVCEEAACPNIGECWTKKHATVMILGDVCTRACAFCNVKTGMPRKVDTSEPQHVADAAAAMGLEHIVITSVDRDDLADGGASQFVKVIEALRRTTPSTTIEILTPDFRNKHEAAVEAIVAAGASEGVPFVLNARTDAVLKGGDRPLDEKLTDAIARGRAYLDAGATTVFVPGLLDAHATRRLVEGIGERKVSVIGVPGALTAGEYEALGVARISYGPQTQRVALTALQDLAIDLYGSGVIPASVRALN